MKKLAEITVGRCINAINNTRHIVKMIVTVSKLREDPNTPSFDNYYYHCHCEACNNNFSSKNIWGLERERYKSVQCPNCGTIAEKEEIVMAPIDTDIPIETTLKIKEYKNKIVLETESMTYPTVKKIKDYKSYNRSKEEFIFDTTNQTVTWIKRTMQMNKNHTFTYNKVDKKEIGYEQDVQEMKRKTALYYLNTQYWIRDKHSNDKKYPKTLNQFLSILREAINKKMNRKTTRENSMYIQDSTKRQVYTNVLNYAHRFRFEDSFNLKPSTSNYKENENLPKDWEEKTYSEYKTIKNYRKSLYKALGIPDTKTTRKYYKKENLFMLMETSKIKDINDANTLRKYILENREQNNHEDIIRYVETYLILAKRYPALKISNMLKNWYKYNLYDVNHLTKLINQIPEYKKEFENTKIRIRDLHNWLSERQKIATLKANHEWIEKYQIDNSIVNNLNRKINGYDFNVVPNTKTLIHIAETLHNCSASYNMMIGDKTQLVVVTDDDKNIIALLEINKGVVKQAKLLQNAQVKTNKSINTKVIAFMKQAHLQCDTYDVDMEAA